MIAPLLAALLSAAAAAAPIPGTVLDAVDKDTAAWNAYQRIHSDFFDIDKVAPADAREVQLGRELFFDPRLSVNGAMSCWSCHDPSRAWGDGMTRARGLGHKELKRRTVSLLTTHRNIPFPLYWDGRAPGGLGDAIKQELFDASIMGADERSLLLALDRVPSYARRMVDLYGPRGISADSAVKALSAFIRAAAVPRGSPFDRYAREPSALSASAKNGMVVFAGQGRCLLCHTGAYFSDDFWHNVGLKGTPGLEDHGRGALVPEKHADGAFHTPTLRDVAKTGPYMHDGSEKTLRDVVEFYSRGGDRRDGGQDDLVVPLNLSERDKADLVAFLEALSGPDQKVAFPVLPPEASFDTPAESFAAASRRLASASAEAARRPALAAAHAASAVEALERWKARGGADCAASAARAAAALEVSASARRPDAAARAASAAAALARCEPAPEPGEGVAAALPPPNVLVDAADGSLSEAGKLLDQAEAVAPNLYGDVPEPLPDFDIPRFLADLAGGRWSAENTDILEQAVRADVMRYYEYKTFMADDPASCAEIKIHKIYFGVNRTGEWACRERHYENELSHALIVRPPDFDRRCRESMIAGYPELEIKDGAGACKVMRAHLDAPGPCGPLIEAGFLQAEKRVSCDNFFARIWGMDDAVVCKTLDGGPTAWRDRCLALSAYSRAYKARDPRLCQDRSLCLAFMGDRKGSVESAADAIRREASEALRRGWQYEARPRVERALALAEDARARLAAAENQRSATDRALARRIDSRAEELARVFERAERLRALPPPPKAFSRSGGPS